MDISHYFLFALVIFINLVRGDKNGEDSTTVSNLVDIGGDSASSAAVVKGGNSTELPMSVYLKAHSYLTRSKVYRNYTLEDTIHHVDRLENWEPPRELVEKFPYYFSGYDYEDLPVWIAEVGKYNVREIVERGPEWSDKLTQYLFQGCLRIMKSMIAKDTDTKEIRGVFLVGDWEGLDISQGASVATVQYVSTLLRTHVDFLHLAEGGRAVAINVSYFTTQMFNLIRPILGSVFERIELYGTNKAKWQVALQRVLPPNVIPTWYGGSKDYKPIQVYG